MPLPKESTGTIDDIYALPDGQRAEIINGVWYDMAPPSRLHQQIVQYLSMSIGNHVKAHGGSCQVYPAPFAVFLFADDTTYVEPDVSVVCNLDKLDDRGCTGAPDIAIEVVSESSRTHDNLVKLNAYRDAGVREYWIVDPRRKLTKVISFHPEDYRDYAFGEPANSSVLEGLTLDFAEFA